VQLVSMLQPVHVGVKSLPSEVGQDRPVRIPASTDDAPMAIPTPDNDLVQPDSEEANLFYERAISSAACAHWRPKLGFLQILTSAKCSFRCTCRTRLRTNASVS
jgi:hypothetical protein